MAGGTWFDDLTRALALGGGRGGRRGFLRMLLGGAAGAAVGALLPPDAQAAPVDQATCNPRPPVAITNTPFSTGLDVTVSSTGTGNTLRRVTFGAIRNGVVDVPGVATGAGSGFSYAVPTGATQTAFSVRAVDTSQVVQIPFTVTDGCGDWRTFVGTGAGALQNPKLVCPTWQTTLTAEAPAGTTSFQVANPGCFTVGDKMLLDPDGPSPEQLDVVGVTFVQTQRTSARTAAGGGSVQTSAPAFRTYSPFKYAARRLRDGTTCDLPRGAFPPILDECAKGSVCCGRTDSDLGSCCPLGACCDTTGSGVDIRCHDDSDFASDLRNCGFCGNQCDLLFSDTCRNSTCMCGTHPKCTVGECINGQCCTTPCGLGRRICCQAGDVCGDDFACHCRSGQTGAPGIRIRDVCCASPSVPCAFVGGPVICCPAGSICLSDGTCQCDCYGNRYNVSNGICGCGGGAACSAAQGQVCTDGKTCTCFGVINPGDQLCVLRCENGSPTGSTCPATDGFGNALFCCRAGDGSYFCSTETCPGGVRSDPLCTK